MKKRKLRVFLKSWINNEIKSKVVMKTEYYTNLRKVLQEATLQSGATFLNKNDLFECN